VQYRLYFYGCFAHLRESYFARIICKAPKKLAHFLYALISYTSSVTTHIKKLTTGNKVFIVSVII